MDIQREIADQYQGLFNIMKKEHNIILTISEMDEIIIEAQKTVNKNFTNGWCYTKEAIISTKVDAEYKI